MKDKKKTRDQKFPNGTTCNLYSDFYILCLFNEIFHNTTNVIKLITECQFRTAASSCL